MHRISYMGLVKLESLSSATDEYITLIIPTLNEEEYIGKLLQSICEQTYPPFKFEILLFDGRSQDRTLEIVKKYQEHTKNKLNIKIFQNKMIKQVYAWNEGIKKAQGKYFIILGAHSYLETDFIQKSIDTFKLIKKRERKLAGVGGSLETVYKNSFAKLIKLLYASPFTGVSSFWNDENKGFKETVVFGLYDKQIVQNVGCFDEDFIIGDDYELNLRLNQKGYKLYSNPHIKSYYFTRSSFKSFLKQSFQYGAVKGMCIRTGYNKLLWWVPLIFLIFELVLIITAGTILFPFLLAVIIFYFLVSTIFALKIYYKFGEPLALTLALLHFLFHNVVALGLLKGLIWGRRTFR